MTIARTATASSQGRDDPESVEHTDGAAADRVPLVVDLEGALLRSDLLIESIFARAKKKPLDAWKVPWWLARGTAESRRELMRDAAPDVSTLPYRQDLLEYLRNERSRGRALVLATDVDAALANAVADALGLFDGVIAPGAETSQLESMQNRLIARFGERGFDYAAGAGSDPGVWSAARKAILVQPRGGLTERVERTTPIERVFADDGPALPNYVRALRPHHWLKNALIFLPLVDGHRLYEPVLLGRTLLAFVAFTLCACSMYLLNDLLDLASDRRHPEKRHRALAAGLVSTRGSLLLIPLLLAAALVTGAALTPALAGILAAYFALMLLYSLGLKELPVVDVLMLAVGYALRVAAGSVAVGVAPSYWLMAFCLFLFYSLALIKPYAELVTQSAAGIAMPRMRGYRYADRALMAIQGIASGYVAVLILALYTTTHLVQGLSGRPELFWMICALLLYWINYLWLAAHRGRICQDPVTFVLRDPMSLGVWGIIAAAALAAT
jgi:4-hydroxybenzoate polyprenyltransferase